VTSYDFRSLNDKEFEAFVTDLLSETEGIRVERFKPGKDAGVDGRWFSTPDRECVVQCKHWVDSGYAALRRHLERKERTKIALLNPSRYLLATSVPLSRDNKRELKDLLSPYVKSEADILGREDLNDLVDRHEAVQQRHYKLWLSSSAVLRHLLNNAIVGRSKAELQQMREESFIYARTTDHDRAVEHLNRRRVLILTGEPGIGKTTLAHQLVLEHVAHGYELIVIEENISEAEAVYLEEGRQIFYFDDFLGRTFLEAIRAKQDSHILSFIRRVARDGSKRFILTSRTNILNQGAALTDLFASSSIDRTTYELRVAQLDQLDRAKIVYNHVWHSALAPDYIDEIYAEKRYHGIIQHRNFNPRLVAFILDSDKVGQIPSEQYWDYASKTLDNPAAVWDHFFTAQLNQESRDITFLTVMNGRSIDERDLQTAFLNLNAGHSTASLGHATHQFGIAIRHCTGSVLDRKLQSDGRVLYSLFNPSIADYVLAHLSGSSLWAHYLPHLRTLQALNYLLQLRNTSYFSDEGYREILRAIAHAEQARGAVNDAYSLRAARIISAEIAVVQSYSAIVRKWLLSPDYEIAALYISDYLSLILECATTYTETDLRECAEQLIGLVESATLPIGEPELLRDVQELLGKLGADEAATSLRTRLVEQWESQVADHVYEQDILGEYSDLDELDAATEKLERTIVDWLTEFGIDLNPQELRRIRAEVDVEAAIKRNWDALNRDDEGGGPWRRSDSYDVSAIDDLFDRSSNHPAD